jgi:hypothetical protein
MYLLHCCSNVHENEKGKGTWKLFQQTGLGTGEINAVIIITNKVFNIVMSCNTTVAYTVYLLQFWLNIKTFWYAWITNFHKIRNESFKNKVYVFVIMN